MNEFNDYPAVATWQRGVVDRQRTLFISDDLAYSIAVRCVAQGMECDALAHTIRLKFPELLREWFAQVLKDIPRHV